MIPRRPPPEADQYQAGIEQKILMVRGQKVISDADLAELYSVSTKRLNQQVRRNHDRFPADFIFQLTKGEKSEVVANCNHLRRLKFSLALPYAFTEHGAIMAASVLNTKRAVEMSVFVVRAFVKLWEILRTHKDLAHKLAELDRKVETHGESIRRLVTAIRQLMAPPPAPPEPPRKRIGFVKEKKRRYIACVYG